MILAHKAGDEADPGNFRLIALTSCLGKPFHQIKADRMADYMTANKYIDPSSQKAFLRGINGCIEHIQVIQEVIQDAKHRKATVHWCTWFDLADAYGSVVHKLIEFCLRHYFVPEPEICDAGSAPDHLIHLQTSPKYWRAVCSVQSAVCSLQ